MAVVTAKDRRRARAKGPGIVPTNTPEVQTKHQRRRQKALERAPVNQEASAAEAEVEVPEQPDPPPPPPDPPSTDAPPAAPPDPPSRMEAIREGIGQLDQNNPDHFTQGGKPKVDAIEAVTGLEDITAQERDEAWEGQNG